MKFFGTLLMLLLNAILVDSQIYLTTSQAYPNGGWNTTFPIGPMNFNVGGVLSSLNLVSTPGVTSIYYLSIALLNSDYSLYPLVGFNYQYTVTGLPFWARYQSSDRSIIATPPNTVTGFNQFNISYTDARKNTASISAAFNQGTTVSSNQFYYATDSSYILTNFYTIAFPLFTTTGSSLSTIRVNSFAALTNIGKFPWTNLVSVQRVGYNSSTIFSSNGVTVSPVYGTSGSVPGTVASGSTILSPGAVGALMGTGTNSGVINTTVYPYTTTNTTTVISSNGAVVPSNTIVSATNPYLFSSNINNGAAVLGQTSPLNVPASVVTNGAISTPIYTTTTNTTNTTTILSPGNFINLNQLGTTGTVISNSGTPVYNTQVFTTPKVVTTSGSVVNAQNGNAF